jgi:hypothetical protein
MEGENYAGMDSNQYLGDGEVINLDPRAYKYPFGFVRDGENAQCWEYIIPESNNRLVSYFRQLFQTKLFRLNYLHKSVKMFCRKFLVSIHGYLLIGINLKLWSLIRRLVKDIYVIFILVLKSLKISMWEKVGMIIQELKN